MSGGDSTSSDVWVQSRRRIDTFFGILGVVTASFASILSQYTSDLLFWKVASVMPIFAVLWFLLRRGIPPEGRVYTKARIRYEHKVAAALASILLPCVLATLAVTWFKLPHAEWFYAFIYSVFFCTLLVTVQRLERSYRSIVTSEHHVGTKASPNV